jgi:hypothetical protein
MASPDFSNVEPALDQTLEQLTSYTEPILIQSECERFAAAKRRPKEVTSVHRAVVKLQRQILLATWNLNPKVYVLVVYAGLDNLVTLPEPSFLQHFIGLFIRYLVQWIKNKIELPAILDDIVKNYREYFPSHDSTNDIRRFISKKGPGDLGTASSRFPHGLASGGGSSNKRQLGGIFQSTFCRTSLTSQRS